MFSGFIMGMMKFFFVCLFVWFFLNKSKTKKIINKISARNEFLSPLERPEVLREIVFFICRTVEADKLFITDYSLTHCPDLN